MYLVSDRRLTLKCHSFGGDYSALLILLMFRGIAGIGVLRPASSLVLGLVAVNRPQGIRSRE